MRRLARRLGLIVGGCAVALLLVPGNRRAAATPPFTAAESNYLLNCGGCHGAGGVTNSRLVPDLKDLSGYYLNVTEGRDYLPRLPNVAFATLSDQQLADVLNYVVFTLGGGSAPAGARRYEAAEVGRLRKHPLNEVALSRYRHDLVETLIRWYRAPADLRIYGAELYSTPPVH